jgi:hypothetical protein
MDLLSRCILQEAEPIESQKYKASLGQGIMGSGKIGIDVHHAEAGEIFRYIMEYQRDRSKIDDCDWT